MKRYSFTLLEIVISIALLSLISSLLVFKGWSLILEHRFLSSARRLHMEVCSARLNALTYGCDLELYVHSTKGGSQLKITAYHPPKPLAKQVNREITLPNLKCDIQEVTFYANGHLSTQTPLKVTPHKGRTLARIISLEKIESLKVCN